MELQCDQYYLICTTLKSSHTNKKAPDWVPFLRPLEKVWSYWSRRLITVQVTIEIAIHAKTVIEIGSYVWIDPIHHAVIRQKNPRYC